MSDRDSINVKRRLAGEGRPPPEIGRVTPERAFKIALARACEANLGLEVFAKSAEMRRTVVSSLLEDLPEHALIALLTGPGGRLGLAILDGQMLAGVIEKQTTGRVVPKPAEGRPPTRTDAVMCNDLVNAILKCFQAEGEDAVLPLTPTWAGFEYALQMEDARAIQMTLEDIPYRMFEAVLDLEKGAKEGRIQLVVPYDPLRATTGGTDGAEASGEGVLTEIVQDTQLEMEAILHRLDLTLSDVAGLSVGSLVPLPRESIVQISIEDIDGKRVCFGRLGAKTGNRAVRLNLSEMPEELDLPPGSAGAGAQDILAPAARGMATEMGAMPEGLDPATAAAPVDVGTAGLPPLAGLPDLPPIGDDDAPPMMGDLPPLDGVGDLPDLPDLPGASGLPDLPDLPALDPVD